MIRFVRKNITQPLLLMFVAVLLTTALATNISINTYAMTPIEQEGDDGTISDNKLILSEGVRIVATINRKSYTYSGYENRPNVSVKCFYQPYDSKGIRSGKQKSVTLKENTDFIVSYINNIEVGKATVLVKGIGNYSFEKKEYFNIYKRNAGVLKIKAPSDLSVSENVVENINNRLKVYDRKQSVSANKYDVIIDGNIYKEGTVRVTVSMNGNSSYAGNIKKASFNINLYEKANVSGNAVVSLKKNKKLVYNGYEICPELKVKLDGKNVKKKNYYVVYENNINAGMATATVYGKNELHGILGKYEYKISPASIKKLKIKKIKPMQYSSLSLDKANVAVRYGRLYLKQNVDYSVSVNDMTSSEFIDQLKDSKGTKAYLTIKLLDANTNFVDDSGNGKVLKVKVLRNNISSKLTTKIVGYPNNSVSNNSISGNNVSGKALDADKTIEPSVEVFYLGDKLTLDKDYSVKYKSKTDKKTGDITVVAKIKGKGIYNGKRKESWVFGKSPY